MEALLALKRRERRWVLSRGIHPGGRWIRHGISLARVFLLLASAPALFSAEEVEPAELDVSGYGLFGNRELESLVSILRSPGEEVIAYDANDLEDAVMILFSRIQRDGYLHPTIKAEVTTANGTQETFTWTKPLGEPLPRPLAARKVKIKVDPGMLFYFDLVRFNGVSALGLRDAASFFIETDALIPLKKNRVYTPERLDRGLRNLEDALRREGYDSARASATNLVVQTNTGAVTVDIAVDEGPRSIVRSIQTVIQPADTNLPPSVQTIQTNVVYSRLWQQDFAQALRREQYEGGHADVRVEITQAAREAHARTNWIDLVASVFPGPTINVGSVRFEGEKHTRESMMRNRVDLREGEPLNPITAERGRYRLSRLGIFDSVDLRYDQVDEETRDVVYLLDETARTDFSLLAGWGSYEMLRGGFEWEQYNLWGLAHHSRLKATQSLKSSSAEYTYTLPELLGEEFDAFVNAQWLRREEISFVREEFGGGGGITRHFRAIDSDLGLRYNYQVLTATRTDVSASDGLREAQVGSFVFDLRHDRRDNPLSPRSGYKVFSSLEVASDVFFGEVNYQRMETSISYHHPLSRFQWLHLGISHGFVVTDGGPERDLPFNKRFFPGGDNSIRGYQYGEAGPRNESGRVVGAETYSLANIEFEQGLTRTWSLVFFFDALGQARRIEDFPIEEHLFSAGGGIRWKSIIGPVRLEYGHNLNAREYDPSGTLHFSIGFPF